MDEPSTLIAGDEPDLILISKILPKRCVNSISTARLTLHGYQILTPTLTRPHKTCAALGFTSPINHQFLK